jgi:hypothetical protein
MSIIVEDEGVTHSAIKNLSCGSFRDLGCLQRLRRLVPFKRPVYEKVVETFSHLDRRC